jgi:hypothetical protein
MLLFDNLQSSGVKSELLKSCLSKVRVVLDVLRHKTGIDIKDQPKQRTKFTLKKTIDIGNTAIEI